MVVGLNDKLAITSTLYETNVIIFKIYGWLSCHAGLVLVYTYNNKEHAIHCNGTVARRKRQSTEEIVSYM